MDAEALPDDGGDDAGPSALLRAAAELIVNEAEQGRQLEAAAALLQLIPTEDLEETVVQDASRVNATTTHNLLKAAACRPEARHPTGPPPPPYPSPVNLDT